LDWDFGGKLVLGLGKKKKEQARVEEDARQTVEIDEISDYNSTIVDIHIL
jgi:hypothetical protein